MKHEKKSEKISGIRQKTHDNVDKIMDKAESIRESGQKEIAHLKEKTTMVKENVDGYIKKNPEKAVLMAVAAGAIAGAAITAVVKRKK
jgi:ElaB/YqjD/DUF883 family membrane-anchored ribosome-binding protein